LREEGDFHHRAFAEKRNKRVRGNAISEEGKSHQAREGEKGKKVELKKEGAWEGSAKEL